MQDLWSPEFFIFLFSLGSLFRLQALHVKNRAKGVTSCKIFGVLNSFIFLFSLGSLFRLQALHVKNRAKGVTSCKIFGVLKFSLRSLFRLQALHVKNRAKGVTSCKIFGVLNSLFFYSVWGLCSACRLYASTTRPRRRRRVAK